MFLNFLFFQICWCACVWGGAQGHWWLGLVAVALFGAYEFARSEAWAADLKLVLLVLVAGIVLDSFYVQAGLLRYATPVPVDTIAPVWIWAMWVSFALTLNHSMAWLKGKTWLAVAFGAIGGPLAYYIAGRAWDAVFFDTSRLALVFGVIAVAWAIATPLLLKLADRFNSTAVAPRLEEKTA